MYCNTQKLQTIVLFYKTGKFNMKLSHYLPILVLSIYHNYKQISNFNEAFIFNINSLIKKYI